jgi:hypothetical protein
MNPTMRCVGNDCFSEIYILEGPTTGESLFRPCFNCLRVTCCHVPAICSYRTEFKAKKGDTPGPTEITKRSSGGTRDVRDDMCFVSDWIEPEETSRRAH